MAGREHFDISPTQRQILEQRAARRQTLRYEYMKQILNPYRHALGTGGHVMDPAIERFMAAKSTVQEFWKPNWRRAFFFIGVYFVPATIMIIIIKADRDYRENQIRTGQVPYSARDYKCN